MLVLFSFIRHRLFLQFIIYLLLLSVVIQLKETLRFYVIKITFFKKKIIG